jgi:putative ABC transport system ATP-binding protein
MIERVNEMLKLENVSYRYRKGNRDVLQGVTAQFENGKVNAIVGPSGSGKTTLLSIMAGMDKPHNGFVSIEGEDLAKMDLNLYRRERIAMVFQAFHLFPLLTAIENVCYPLEASGAKRSDAEKKAEALLESVGITSDKFNRYPANLSGGEQQRVAIARALSVGAKVILADEPTGNLDSANADVVVDILKQLAHEYGYCVVIVTHNPEIAAVSDKIYKMKDGFLTSDTKEMTTEPTASVE